MRSPILTAVLAVSTVLVAHRASATPDITGYSGKPYNGDPPLTCTTNCHAKGGTAPTLTLTVPDSVQAGSTNEVTLVVAGTKARTALNVAFSDGVKTLKGMNTDSNDPASEPSELRSVAPPPSGGTGTYKLSFIAPDKNGPITMWVAGMAASGAGTGGDGVANAERSIMVTGAVAPADAGSSGASGTPSGSSGTSGTSGASSGSSGTSGATPGFDAGGSGSSSGGSSAPRASSSGAEPGDGGGCSVRPAPFRASARSPFDAVIALAGAASVAAIVRRRRRS